jgi:hypothetical protein
VSPSNAPNTAVRPADGFEFYRHGFSFDYHWAPWVALVAVVLAGVGLAARKHVTARAIVFLLLVGLTLTVSHPNHQSRYLHPWLSTVWIMAGAGIAAIAGSRSLAALGPARPVLATLLVALIAAGQYRAFVTAGMAPGLGLRTQSGLLEIADAYRPWIADDRKVAVFTTMPGDHFAEWSYLEANPNGPRPEVSLSKWFGPSPEANKARFDAWLATTSVERVVLVDVPQGSRYYRSGYESYHQIRELMTTQAVFAKTTSRAIAGDEAVATLWERAPLRR